MKKILFINPHLDPLFSATTSGGAHRSQLFLRALTQLGHVDVIPFIDNEISNIPNCDVICSKHPVFSPPKQYGKISKYLRLLNLWNPNNIYPINRSVENFLDKIISSGEYDYIAIRYLHMAMIYGVLKYSHRLILDMDDSPEETLRLKSQNSKSAEWRLYYKLASIVMRLTSRIMLKNIYRVFYSNPKECPSANSVFLPNVSALNTILPPVSEQTSRCVLVVGMWSYPPNNDGLVHFLTNIWPQIISRVNQDIELRVVGRMNDENLRIFCSRIKHVKILGYVEELLPEYYNARCVIIPIYSGTGTCIKTIEAISVNRPFVSTICGVRGLENDLQPGRDYLLAANDQEFVDSVVSLIERPNYGAELAKNALSCAKEKWSVEKFNEIVAKNIS